MSISRFLQDNRIHNHMSVEDVAIKSKLSVGSIRAYEQGRRTPSVVSLKAVLSVYGIPETTWLDSTTWQNPIDGHSYALAPKGGGWPGDRKKTYTRSDSEIGLARTRIEAIEAILLTDRKTLMAVITLLKK